MKKEEPVESRILYTVSPARLSSLSTEMERQEGLALGELETSAGAPLSIFLPFNHAVIAGKEPAVMKRNVIAQIDLAESAGDSVPAGSSLAGDATAGYIDENVVLVLSGGNHERLPENGDTLGNGKKSVDVEAVNDNFSVTLADKNAGDCGFPPAGP
jgi:hypothetical protein